MEVFDYKKLNLEQYVTKKNILIMSLMLISLLTYMINRPIFFVFLLIFIGAVSMVVDRLISMFFFYAQMGYGFELILLVTVISGIAYGSVAGMIVGGLSITLGYILSRRLSIFSIVTVPSYMIIGFLAHYFSNYNIVTVGVLFAILYNMIVSLIIIPVLGAKPVKCLIFGITNVLFNVFMFSRFGDWLLGVMI